MSYFDSEMYYRCSFDLEQEKPDGRLISQSCDTVYDNYEGLHLGYKSEVYQKTGLLPCPLECGKKYKYYGCLLNHYHNKCTLRPFIPPADVEFSPSENSVDARNAFIYSTDDDNEEYQFINNNDAYVQTMPSLESNHVPNYDRDGLEIYKVVDKFGISWIPTQTD